MAKPHQTHIDMMNAFEKAEGGSKINTQLGGGGYGMGKGGMPSAGVPRSPAQMSSVKKAAKASATARGERALDRVPNKATLADKPAAAMAALATPTPKPGVRTGGLGLNLQVNPKKGLLGL